MTASAVVSTTLTASVEQQVLGPNPRRTGILFLAPSVSVIYLRADPLGNVVGGLPIPTGAAPVQLTLEMHGDIIKGPWFAFCTVAPVIGIVETLE